ncbi:hypothetical protein BAUCODRAFT_142062 [Baudoinia panamericana UAMH 10762]|uniref:Carboxylic ester hydrolase n=1 Tax=Baudoinia panamericana (strain UAMH 10762) TaxID=717646 RepID=M2N4G8_BAUPA|nr:uncharacterized protein BAUCODRAFT_142062 [Baudoinia panamericana UAMH 10762]EMC93600.1 hypothetical protein BAUCODRAFT_142062 [Baudoinia panamericana UAMH 10762]
MKAFSISITFLPVLASRVLAQATQPIPSPNGSAPTADLGYVKYQGYTNSTIGINYFQLTIYSYAAPPLGPLRWQKPRAVESNNAYDTSRVYNATQIAPACYPSSPYSTYSDPTVGFSGNPAGFSEDCLILDVLVPTHPVSSRLPVLLMIHGGGYTLGNAQSVPGDGLVNAANGSIIYVSIQYRLGLFGFLGGSQIAQNGALNAGLLDQRAAIEWVQRNIHAFGGDPGRVTIYGGSAGGGSVTYQLIAGGAYDQPPFSAAIPEYPWWQPLLNQSEQDLQFNTALRLSNCSSVSCLRSLSSATLATLNQAVENASYPTAGDAFGVYYFGPVVDGKFVRELPDVAFKRGHFYDVPLLVDHDAYEGYAFSNISQTTQVAETADAQLLFPFAGPAFFSRLYQLYPASTYNSTLFQRQAWFGDFIINCPTYYMATNAVDRNSNSSAVFKLIFAAGNELHAATSAFLLSNVIGFPAANNQTLATIMASYWISFTVTHDPNPLRAANAPFWPSYMSMGAGNVSNGQSVGFDTLSITYTTISPETDPDASAQCDFFGNHGYQVQN